jgi:hypothetical protein
MKKPILSLLVAVFLIGSSSASELTGDLTNGLVGYYKLNGNANDTSVYGNNGTIVGTLTTTNNQTGETGAAYYFNGSSSIASSSPSNRSIVSNNFTLSFWFKANCSEALGPETTSGTSYSHSYVIGGVHGGDGSGIQIAAGTNGISVLEQGSGFLPVVLSYQSDFGSAWVQATITVSNNQAPILYVNGNYADTGLNTGRAKIASIFAGDNYEGIGGMGYGYFTGAICDVGIWNTALTSSQVSQLYGIQSVPEPSTYALFGLGALALIVAYRRKVA